MTIKDLIQNKDYDHIEIYLTLPKVTHNKAVWDKMTEDEVWKNSIFMGIAKSEHGELISLDGDTYSDEDEVLYHEEFINEVEGVLQGLSIVIPTDWILG